MKNTLLLQIKKRPGFWAAFFLITFLKISASGQSTCFALCFSTENAQTGDTIQVDVTVRGYKQMLGHQFCMQWDPAALQYVRQSTAGSLLNFQLINPFSAAQGLLRTAWTDQNVTGISLPDDGLLFKAYFKVLAIVPGFYPIKVDPDDITSFVFFGEYNNELPLSHVVGGVHVNQPSDFTLDTLCVTAPACFGNPGHLKAVVNGGIPPYHYLWAGPNGFTSSENTLSVLEAGRYYLTVSDDQGAVVQAITGFISDNSNLSASAATQIAKCKISNGCVNLTVTGGTPPYSFEWENPSIIASSRCDLPAGQHVVTVTDSKGCFVLRPFVIEKDTVLHVELMPSHADCRFDQLGAVNLNTDGFAPFTYQWSNGATSSNLTAISPGNYSVKVEDSKGCAGIATVQVKDYGTFDWVFAFDGDCEENTEFRRSLELKGFAMAQRATPPLSISWENGTRQEIRELDPSVVYLTLSNLTGLSNGYYTVTVTDADGCSQEREAVARCYKEEPFGDSEPIFYLKPDMPDGKAHVYGKWLKGVKKIQFSLFWNEAQMTLDQIPASPFLNGTSNNFTIHQEKGQLDFSWQSPSANGFYSDYETKLFTLAFKDNTVPSTWLDFGAYDVLPFVVDHATEGRKPFLGRVCSVYFSVPAYGIPIWPIFNLTPPSCRYEGYRRVQLRSDNDFNSNPDPYLALINSIHWAEPKLPASALLFVKPGRMLFRSLKAGSFIMDVPPYSLPATECVWPGDADNNNMVNHFDLLYMGVGLGQFFVPREEPDSIWQGADSPDWPQKTATRQVNFKNLDTDGNGMIEIADTSVIMHHWGKSTNSYEGQRASILPATPDTILSQTNITIESDTVNTGVQVKIPLTFNGQNLRGLAFSLSYDPAIVSVAPRFEPAASWLGDPAVNLISIQKNFPGQSRLDVAITRTDEKTAEGFGQIGYIVVTFKKLPPDSLRSTLMFMANVLAITAQEKLIAFGETRKEIMLRGSTVSGTNAPAFLSDSEITLSPNPAGHQIRLESRESLISHVTISDANGAFRREIDWKVPAPIVEIELDKLPAGTYFARIICEKGLLVKKFVVFR